MELIAGQEGESSARLCALVELDRSTFYRRRAREAAGRADKGPWLAPERRRIEQPAAQLALEWPAWGHRTIWALLQADEIATSQSTVRRALAARGLLQPPGVQRERRELAKARRATFVAPASRRNQVWQMDFSEFETNGQGIWNLGGIVDYHAKLASGCPLSVTKTGRDAIAALEHARDHATDLLGRALIEDFTDPDTGEPVPLIVVTDNGSALKGAAFPRHLRGRPEFRQVRTRVKSPETNGQVERFFGALKYKHLYRHDISDGLDVDAHVARFLDDYNRRRPHEAIDFALPIDVAWTPSSLTLRPLGLLGSRDLSRCRRPALASCSPGRCAAGGGSW